MKPILEINKNYLYSYREVSTYFNRSTKREYLKRLRKKGAKFMNFPGEKSSGNKPNKFLDNYYITGTNLIEYLGKNKPECLLNIKIINSYATDSRNLQQSIDFIEGNQGVNIQSSGDDNELRSNDGNTEIADKCSIKDEGSTEMNEEIME